MAKETSKTQTAAGTKNPADEVGADQVQQAFDEAAEQGYFGHVPDETPNENYSLETPQDAPTPENTRGQKLLEEQKAREANKQRIETVPNPVALPHVVARYPGTLSSGQQINAQAYISDAWALLLRKRPTLEADITAATVTNADVIRVVSTAVVRKLINPEGKSEESIDDYRFKFGGDNFGDLYFTDEELVDVTPIPVYGDTRGSVKLVAFGYEVR